MRSVSENKRAKILVGIINKEDEAKYTSAVNEVATALHFSGLGHGTARQNYMTYFGFNEIGKVVTMSLIPGALEHNILSNVGHKLRLYLVEVGDKREIQFPFLECEVKVFGEPLQAMEDSQMRSSVECGLEEKLSTSESGKDEVLQDLAQRLILFAR